MFGGGSQSEKAMRGDIARIYRAGAALACTVPLQEHTQAPQDLFLKL